MDDTTLLRTMKNGLMIAGHEMGPVGDHWPAIQAVSKGLEEEFEHHHRNQAVLGELEFHLAEIFHEAEEIAAEANPEDKAQIMAFVKEMWERYYAILEPVDAKMEPDIADLVADETKAFPKMKAAVRIIENLGGRT
jgi:flagellar biosynthesis/type III secretory pathway protein FliH